MASAIGATGLVAGLLLGGYGLALIIAEDQLPASLTRPTAVGGAMLVVGLALFFVALASLTHKRAPPPAPAPVAYAPPPQPARPPSDFPWTGGQAQAAESTTDNRLDDVRRRIGHLKVRYGLGEVSPEAYKKLMSELENEEADLQRQRQAEGEA